MYIFADDNDSRGKNNMTDIVVTTCVGICFGPKKEEENDTERLKS